MEQMETFTKEETNALSKDELVDEILKGAPFDESENDAEGNYKLKYDNFTYMINARIESLKKQGMDNFNILKHIAIDVIRGNIQVP